MSKFLGFFKLFVFFALIVPAYSLCSFTVYLFFYGNPQKFIQSIVQINSFFCSTTLRLINVKVIRTASKFNLDESFLIVCNHVSYLDILIINRYFPSCFVTSLEIQNTPFLGFICKLSGCIFVNRKNYRSINTEISQLTRVLNMGTHVSFFPEGTSTDGYDLGKFKKPLFKAAIDSNKKILPLCLNYKYINDDVVTTSNRDNLFWYGDHSFFPHVVKLFCCQSIEVELSVLDEIETEGIQEKSILCDLSYEKIKSKFIPIL